MKKQIATITLMALLAACGGEPKNEKTETVSDPSSNPDYQKGVELIAKSDCLTCHKINDKLIGPAYKDVANKYENNEENVNMLATKIMKGGKDVWGPIPMSEHRNISEADAKQMVKYILLLRKK